MDSVSVITSSTTATTTAPGSGIITPQPLQPDMLVDCNKSHYISKGNACDQITSYNGISHEDVTKWNPRVGTSCTSMWANAYARISIIGGTKPPLPPQQLQHHQSWKMGR